MARRIRIVSDGPTTQGTRVEDADTGEDLGLRVTAIDLVGRLGDVWRVKLSVIVDEVDVVAEEQES